MDPSLPLLPALSRAGRYGILPYNIKRKLQHFAERREAEGLQGLQPALEKSGYPVQRGGGGKERGYLLVIPPSGSVFPSPFR